MELLTGSISNAIVCQQALEVVQATLEVVDVGSGDLSLRDWVEADASGARFLTQGAGRQVLVTAILAYPATVACRNVAKARRASRRDSGGGGGVVGLRR